MFLAFHYANKKFTSFVYEKLYSHASSRQQSTQVVNLLAASQMHQKLAIAMTSPSDCDRSSSNRYDDCHSINACAEPRLTGQVVSKRMPSFCFRRILVKYSLLCAIFSLVFIICFVFFYSELANFKFIRPFFSFTFLSKQVICLTCCCCYTKDKVH